MNKTNIARKLRMQSETERLGERPRQTTREREKSNYDDEEKLLKLMEIKNKQSILRTFKKTTLKDVDYEQLVINNVLCLDIGEQDI